jgi:hypothetical protein
LDEKQTSIEQNINNWSKNEFNLIASQIKLVKKRDPVENKDWMPYSTTKKLKYNFIKEYSSPIKEYSTIQFAKSENQWMDFCNKGIPACASFEFDPSNDNTHGMVYNRYVFLKNNFKEGNNLPVVEGAKTMELIDLLELKHSHNGDLNEFFNLLFNEHNLKNGGKCTLPNSSKDLKWQKGIDEIEWNDYFGSYHREFGYILLSNYNDYFEKELILLKLYSSYNGQLNESFFKPEFIELSRKVEKDDNERFDGYSIRFLKN